jgi:Saxitoxin biosynthesis operon protein SxtJ
VLQEKSVSSISTDPTRKQLRSFGLTMAGALVVVAAIRVWRRGNADDVALSAVIVAALFAIAGFIPTEPLAPVYRWWMRLAEGLGWINTRILLILIFYLVVTPLGLVMRLLRRPPLDMARRDSYWTEPPRNSYGDRHYEKQF